MGINSKENYSIQTENNSKGIKSVANNSNKNNKRYENNLFLKKKRHTKYSTDNIFRKINVHYLNFVVQIVNEVMNKLKLKKKGKFKEINYDFKRKLTIAKFNQIKKQPLNFFLIQDNNKKYKEKNINKILYNKCKTNKELNNFLSKSYIDIFKDYYYKNEKDINFEDLKLHIPRTFDDFLEVKEIKENNSYKKKIHEVVRKNFLQDQRRKESDKIRNQIPKFIIQKIE